MWSRRFKAGKRPGLAEAKIHRARNLRPHGRGQSGNYLVNMSKEKRSGRIFSTICATTAWRRRWRRFRPRARDGATVSMPLDLEPGEKGA